MESKTSPSPAGSPSGCPGPQCLLLRSCHTDSPNTHRAPTLRSSRSLQKMVWHWVLGLPP